MKIGYRKMILAVLFTFIGLGVEILTKNGLTQGLVELLLGLYGAFAVGNMSEHWAATKKPPMAVNVTQAPQIDAELHSTTEAIGHSIGDLHDKSDQLLRSQHVAQEALSFLVDVVQKTTTEAQNGTQRSA